MLRCESARLAIRGETAARESATLWVRGTENKPRGVGQHTYAPRVDIEHSPVPASVSAIVTHLLGKPRVARFKDSDKCLDCSSRPYDASTTLHLLRP